MNKYIEPKINCKSFTCPYCDTLSNITWDKVYLNGTQSDGYLLYKNTNTSDVISVSTCAACNSFHIWYNGKMILPVDSNISMPNEDMPDKVKEIYLEAREVYPHSKRAAVALLRLAVQVLCKELGEEGKNINNDIGSLVSKGLPIQVQQALDSIRVIGNNAVHPGVIDVNEDDVAGTLFSILNLIVEYLITQPKKIREIYENLPQAALEGIEKRDGK